MIRLFAVPFLILGLVLGPAPHARAAEAAVSGEETRRQVNLAGRQRMLSQQIVLMLCMARKGVKPEETTAAARTAISEFDTVLRGLRFGDPAIGLPMETRREVLDRLARVEDIWPRFRGMAQAAADAGAPLDALRGMAPQILGAMNDAVQVIAAMGHSEGSKELLHTVDIAGRQRMLLVRGAMEVCMATLAIDRTEDAARATKTRDLFEASMRKLREGDEVEGIVPPPMWEIDAMLELVEKDWGELKAVVEEILSGGNGSVDALDRLLLLTTRTLNNMNEAVWIYESI